MTIPNSNGTRIIYERMDQFDKLPKAMREALRYADHNWSGGQLLRYYRKKHPAVRTAALAVRFIRSQDAERHNSDTSDPGFVGVMPGQR
jgi:hypothetical protein